MVAEVSAGRKPHEHLVILPVECDFSDAGGGFTADHFSGSAVHGVPESHNIGVSCAPGVHQRLHLLLGHLRSHGLQCADTAAITAGQGSLLAFLTVFVVRVALDDGLLRNMEHAAGSRFVDLSFTTELVQHPFFSGKPSKHAGFNSRKVSHNKAASFLRDERCAYEFGECAGDGAKERVEHFFIPGLYDLSCQIEVRKVVLGEILDLNQSASPSERARGAAELQEAVNTTVPAYRARHGFVLLYAGLAQFKSEVQKLRHDTVRLRSLFLYNLLGEGFHGHVLVCQPCFQLIDASGILQSGQLLCLLIGCFRKHFIDSNGVFDELLIHSHTPVVDLLIQSVQLPLMIRQRPRFQRLANGALGLYVLRIVLLI